MQLQTHFFIPFHANRPLHMLYIGPLRELEIKSGMWVLYLNKKVLTDHEVIGKLGELWLTVCSEWAESNISSPLAFPPVLKHVWWQLRFFCPATELSPTNQAAWGQQQKQRQCTVTLTKHFHAVGRKCPRRLPSRSPPRGQVISGSTLRSFYKPAVKEKTTNANPFLRRAAKTNRTEGGGRGVHQPGCAVRFEATAWGWVATEHLVYTKHYGHHIGKPVRNAGLQKGPFMIMRLFALSQSWWLKDQTKTSSKVAPCSYSV